MGAYQCVKTNSNKNTESCYSREVGKKIFRKKVAIVTKLSIFKVWSDLLFRKILAV